MGGQVEGWQWAVVLKYPAMFVLSIVILYPARRAVMRWMKDGRVKRLLLFRVSETASYRRTGSTPPKGLE
jgi:hypothetical protein